MLVARGNTYTASKLIYLASPYSHADPKVRQLRYEYCVVAVAELLHQGIFAYSPILHNHAISCFRDLGRDFEAWEKYDITFLVRCDELRILTLEGWQESKGVTGEIQWANGFNIPITFMDPVPIPEGFKLMEENHVR